MKAPFVALATSASVLYPGRRFGAGMMEEEIDSDVLSARIKARRLELGITDADDEACRNSGLRRTPEKREILRRIAERCREAGEEPLPANF